MDYQQMLEKLNRNPKEKSLEAVRLLVKIAENLIKNPGNIKMRTLQKSNPTVASKILNVDGSVMCLNLMGFEEHETCFLLPAEASLSYVNETKDTLLMWKESVDLPVTNKPSTKETSSKEEVIKPIILPPLVSRYNHPFFHKLEVQFHTCLRYANRDVQERARKLIPLMTLEKSAQGRLRAIQQHAKKNKLSELDLSLQDMLILELLQWFKEDFFSWVDSPDCDFCGGKTHFSQLATDKSLFIYTNRIELHKCEKCYKLTQFARYEDLNILLETRRGRCGEWANVFTLFCYALGWDARFVLDENDHVWTEVYSIAQKRWLHCDPCENICDKPLIYESGWKKNMTYVIAYSHEDVQDVTWRYSSHHQEVLKRRKLCDETQLIQVLLELRQKRQASFSHHRKSYLTKRTAWELADMLCERKPEEEENKERQSGDVIWRLARGEAHDEPASEYVWKINLTDLIDNNATIKYSAASDVYQFITGGNTKFTRRNWSGSCFSYTNIFRKEEKDWKQVYLARVENEGEGRISWKFEIEGDSPKKLDTIIVCCHHATFHTATVEVNVRSGDLCEVIPKVAQSIETNLFAGKTTIIIEAVLKGGVGDVAWQHAQLFRQTLDSDTFPFTINFIFK